jgi:hypothetical protein
MLNDIFKFVIPAELEKSDDPSKPWKIRGLASTESRDKQGEVILQKGIDLSPIDNKKGLINYDHGKMPTDILGTLDGYRRTPEGLYIEGRLFKNHTQAKAVYEIMSSLGKSDKNLVGLSVEGKIIERDSKNPKIIKKCQINAVAVTLNPVNADTYVDLVKSMNSSESIEFNSTEENMANNTEIKSDQAIFTATQVMAIVQKALGLGAGYTQAPAKLSGGDALAQEEFDSKKKKKAKKMDKGMYKSNMLNILDKLQILYPDHTRAQLWESVKHRFNESFEKATLEDTSTTDTK